MEIKKGLKNVVALESKISRIDGEKSILEYRGYNIHDLVKYSSYEEVVFLLWYGYLPNKKELNEFSTDLSERRELPPEIIGLLNILPKDTHPMVILRTSISYLGSLDKKLHNTSFEENLEKSKDLVAKIPTIVAYYQRIVEKKPLIHPNKNLGHAANFLWMLRGKKATRIEEKTIDLDLILHAEHGLNASTFSARIAASTLSDIYAGVVAATGVLMGAIHGGASQEVIKMFRELKGKKNLSNWLKEKFQKKERIPGFGHRVYKTIDPRAKEFKKLAKRLAKINPVRDYKDREKAQSKQISNGVKRREWLVSLSEDLVKEMKKRKKNLYPNVDFYAASLYPNLGIPDGLFIDIFAIGRIAGWCAHLMEQYEDNKLIRPLQRYVGKKNKKYIPISKRR